MDLVRLRFASSQNQREVEDSVQDQAVVDDANSTDSARFIRLAGLQVA